MQAKPRWGVLTYPHLSVGLQQAPLGCPRKPLAPAFPNMPRFTFLGQPLRPPARPTRPSGAGGGLPALCLAPGAASLGLACSWQLDQMTQAFELSQHHLPGVPCAVPWPRVSVCHLPCPQIPFPHSLWNPQTSLGHASPLHVVSSGAGSRQEGPRGLGQGSPSLLCVLPLFLSLSGPLPQIRSHWRTCPAPGPGPSPL